MVDGRTWTTTQRGRLEEGLVPRDDDEKRERTFLERLAEEAVHASAHAELLRRLLAICTERDDRQYDRGFALVL